MTLQFVLIIVLAGAAVLAARHGPRLAALGILCLLCLNLRHQHEQTTQALIARHAQPADQWGVSLPADRRLMARSLKIALQRTWLLSTFPHNVI